MNFDYVKRVKKIQSKLSAKECALVSSFDGFNANAYYFFGEQTFPCFGLLTKDNARLYSLKEPSHNTSEWIALKKFWKQLLDALKEFRAKKIFVEEKSVAKIAFGLQKKGKTIVSWKEFSNARVVKDAQEIACIKKAQALTKKVVAEVLDSNNRVYGKTENEVAGLLEKKARDYGTALNAFTPIVLSGARAANPHGVPCNKAINDLLLVDVGARFENYCGDYSTTVYEGKNQEIKRVVEAVKEAKKAAESKARVGVKGSVLADAALEVLREYGFGGKSFKKIGLSIGHFIGLDVHEGAPLEKTLLRKGMVFTIEPGIYVPKEYGVRFEDVKIL